MILNEDSDCEILWDTGLLFIRNLQRKGLLQLSVPPFIFSVSDFSVLEQTIL